MNERELYHHGVKGQKWNERHGPPYPLSGEDAKEAKEDHLDNLKKRSDNSGTGAKLKKAGKQVTKLAKKSIASGKRKVQQLKEAEAKRRAEAIRAEQKRQKAEAERLAKEAQEQLDKFKDQIVKKGDIKAITENIELFSDRELQTINFRLQELNRLNPKAFKKPKTIEESTRSAANILQNLQNSTNNAKNVYNNVADIVNSLGKKNLPKITNKQNPQIPNNIKSATLDALKDKGILGDYTKAAKDVGKELQKQDGKTVKSKDEKPVKVPEAVNYVKSMSYAPKHAVNKNKTLAAEAIFPNSIDDKVGKANAFLSKRVKEIDANKTEKLNSVLSKKVKEIDADLNEVNKALLKTNEKMLKKANKKKNKK